MVDVTHTVRGQVGLAVLVLWNLELAAGEASVASGMQGNWCATYPSYNPTASCTNNSVSSGKSDGRKAVVRSSWCRNIQAIHGGGATAIVAWRGAAAARRSFTKAQPSYRHERRLTANSLVCQARGQSNPSPRLASLHIRPLTSYSSSHSPRDAALHRKLLTPHP